MNNLIWSWSEMAINQLEAKRISNWTNKILYQEIIKGTSGLASLYRPENKSEVLIIGDGYKRILEYRIR